MTPSAILLALAVVVVTAAVVYRQLAVVRAARAQSEAERFARDIIDHAGDGIVVFDRELRCVLWNDFMKELTGVEAVEVVHHSAAEVFPQEPHVEELLGRVLAGETVSSPDMYFDGRWVSAVCRPYVDEEGSETAGVIAMLRDITARK